jgi:hypothetical protein
VSRMCPATDREKVKNVDHCRSPKPLVTGTFGCLALQVEPPESDC